jgi:SNF2 family DNA or RNA helicase
MMALCGEKKLCLSGTPLRNYSSDIYSQLRFIGYKDQLQSKNFTYHEYTSKKLQEWLLYKEYQDTDIVLPERFERVIELELKDKEKDIYDYYQATIRKIYHGYLLGTYDFSCVLTLFLRLRQVCCSAYTILDTSQKKTDDYTLSQEVLDNMTDGLASWLKDKDGTAGLESCRIQAILKVIESIPTTEKILVFTSFKKFLYLMKEAYTKKTGRNCLVLNGDITGKERDIVLDTFKKDNDINVMFIVFKVGSEGLNLTEANHVVLCETTWTPVVGLQSSARVHRIGQTKDVHIYKFVIKNSIETRMEQICQEKLALINDFVKHNKQSKRITLDRSTLFRIIR